MYFWVDRLTSLIEKKNSNNNHAASAKPAAQPIATVAPTVAPVSPPLQFVSSPSLEIPSAPRKGPPARSNTGPISPAAPAAAIIPPREHELSPALPSQKVAKSVIFNSGSDRPPPPPRNVAGSSLNVRSHMTPTPPTTSPPGANRPPPPRGLPSGVSTLSLKGPATPTKEAPSEELDSKSGKPAPPKRLPPKPPGLCCQTRDWKLEQY